MFNKCKKITTLLIITIILLNICFSQFTIPKTYAANNTVRGDMIAHSSHDERNKYHGGAPGDQLNSSGEKAEVNIRPFYKRPWNLMLRYTNKDKMLEKKVRNAIAENAVLAALNPHIGYDMDTREGFLNQVSKVNYDVNRLTTDCNSDCSSFVGTIVTIVGHQLGIQELTSIGIPCTADMRGPYTSRGFVPYSDSKYLESAQYLEPGDILVNEGHHTAIYVGDAHDSSSASWPSLEIDDITVNLDELNFDFAGSPKNVSYMGKRKLGILIFSKIAEFIDYIINLILNGIKYSILGYAMAFESIVNNAIKAIEGT